MSQSPTATATPLSNDDFHLGLWVDKVIALLRAENSILLLDAPSDKDQRLENRLRELLENVPATKRREALRQLRSRLRVRPAAPSSPPPAATGDFAAPPPPPPSQGPASSPEAWLAAAQQFLPKLSADQLSTLLQDLVSKSQPRDQQRDKWARTLGLHAAPPPPAPPPAGSADTFGGSCASSLASTLGLPASASISDDRAVKLSAMSTQRLIAVDRVFTEVYNGIHIVASMTPPPKDGLIEKMRSFAQGDPEMPGSLLEQRLGYTEKHLAAFVVAVNEAWKKSQKELSARLSPDSIVKEAGGGIFAAAKCWETYTKQYKAFSEETRTIGFQQDIVRITEEWAKKTPARR